MGAAGGEAQGPAPGCSLGLGSQQQNGSVHGAPRAFLCWTLQPRAPGSLRFLICKWVTASEGSCPGWLCRQEVVLCAEGAVRCGVTQA